MCADHIPCQHPLARYIDQLIVHVYIPIYSSLAQVINDKVLMKLLLKRVYQSIKGELKLSQAFSS